MMIACDRVLPSSTIYSPCVNATCGRLYLLHRRTQSLTFNVCQRFADAVYENMLKTALCVAAMAPCRLLGTVEVSGIFVARVWTGSDYSHCMNRKLVTLM